MANETRLKKKQAWLALLALTFAGMLTACVSESTSDKKVQRERDPQSTVDADHQTADPEVADPEVAGDEIKNRPIETKDRGYICLLYTSPSPRDRG